MSQKFKLILPWIIVCILCILLFVESRKVEFLNDSIKQNESIIDSLRSVKENEESLVDSFSVVRDSIIISRDSTLKRVDSLDIFQINDIIKNGIKDYENYFN